MKTFVYLIVCIAILSVGSLFVLKSPKGEPWLKTSDFYNEQALTNKVINLKNTVINKTQSLINTESDPTIYKWQDEQGVWHYSDSKNTKGATWIKPENLTVIPAIKPLEKSEIHRLKKENKSTNVNQNTSRVDNVKNLINDTHNIQNIMDNRTKNIDSQLK